MEQQNNQAQQSEIETTTTIQEQTKTPIAQAVQAELQQEKLLQGLQFSGSQQSESSHAYTQLDSFVEDETEVSQADSEVVSEPEPEKMSDQDIQFTASLGVSTCCGLIESFVKAPVSIPEEAKEHIAEKAAPVVRKHMGDGVLPWWIRKHQEEFALGIAVASTMFEFYKQVKVHNMQQAALAKNSEPEQKEVA